MTAASEPLTDHDAELLRAWADKIRAVGEAKGWSVWASAFMHPDIEFVDTDMPSTESIVSQLRREDRLATLSDAADMLAADAERGRKSGLTRIYQRAAAARLQELAKEAGAQTSAAHTGLPEFLRVQAALLDLHPKDANPRHGCCVPPTVCKGHPAECTSGEHHVGGDTPWPCRTLRAAGITSDKDADDVRAAVEEFEEEHR